MGEGRIKRRGLISVLILVFLIIVLSSLVFADESCFLHPESEYYCQEISEEIAKVECFGFDDCFFDVLFPGVSCNFFEECTEIMCQSSCELTASGDCRYGGIPSGKEESWCASSCCRFLGNEGHSCQELGNEWECQIAAKNSGTSKYSYEEVYPSETCSLECVLEVYSEEVSLSETEIFSVYEFEKELSEEFEVGELGDEYSKGTSAEIVEVELSEESAYEKNGSGRGILVFPFAAIVFILILLYMKSQGKNKKIGGNGLAKQKSAGSNNSSEDLREMQSFGQGVEKEKVSASFFVKQPDYGLPKHAHTTRKKQRLAEEFTGYVSEKESDLELKNRSTTSKEDTKKLVKLIKKHERKTKTHVRISDLHERWAAIEKKKNPFEKLKSLLKK